MGDGNIYIFFKLFAFVHSMHGQTYNFFHHFFFFFSFTFYHETKDPQTCRTLLYVFSFSHVNFRNVRKVSDQMCPFVFPYRFEFWIIQNSVHQWHAFNVRRKFTSCFIKHIQQHTDNVM